MSRLLVLLSALLLAARQPEPVAQLPAASPHRLAEQGETGRLLQSISDERGVDRRDVCSRTPLMVAAQYGHVDTVQALLRRGARVDLHEKGYYTALMLAAGNGHTEVVRLLAQAGADVNEVELTRGWTALIWAAKRGHRETVRLLLALRADPSIRDRRGRSARDWAGAQGYAEIAALL